MTFSLTNVVLCFAPLLSTETIIYQGIRPMAEKQKLTEAYRICKNIM
jgi:hypothetical protein